MAARLRHRKLLKTGILWTLLTLVPAGVAFRLSAQEPSASAASGLRFLSKEVPSWRPENGCFSCHNNGDGARVLFLATRLDYPVSRDVLQETLSWLNRPSGWDENKGNPGFSDKRLARVQFANSLLEAYRAGMTEPEALKEAARSLLPHQSEEGSWPIDIGEQVGSPVTYGTPLATAIAIQVLEEADSESFSEPIQRARRWLLGIELHSIPDAAAVLFVFPKPTSDSAALRASALELFRESRKSDGGWGPYRFSPSEVFDTSLALLALQGLSDQTPGLEQAIQMGRTYLEEAQLDSGGWIETTRPSGAESYAQHVSTSAWATQALMETAPAGGHD